MEQTTFQEGLNRIVDRGKAIGILYALRRIGEKRLSAFMTGRDLSDIIAEADAELTAEADRLANPPQEENNS